ncbi:hypothetical protein LIA77_11895 [Sarocladium implicatum]|nr:hypothetical protein LIA77_11895 [Sarocladium implicatum]
MRPELPIIALAAAASALPTGISEAEHRDVAVRANGGEKRAPPGVNLPGPVPNLQGAPVPIPQAEGEWMPKPQPVTVSKPKIPEGGPKIPEGGVVSKPKIPEGGPKIPEGGPKIPEGGPKIPEGGPKIPEGGSKIPEGGPKIPEGGPKIPEGGPKIPEGGPKIPEGGPKIPEGGPKIPEGGPKIPKGGPKPGFKPCPAPPTPEEIKKAEENADKEFREFVKHILESLVPKQTRAWKAADEICDEIKIITENTDHDYVAQVNIFLHYISNLRIYGQTCGEKSFIFDHLKADIQTLCEAEGCEGSDEWFYPKKSA